MEIDDDMSKRLNSTVPRLVGTRGAECQKGILGAREHNVEKGRQTAVGGGVPPSKCPLSCLVIVNERAPRLKLEAPGPVQKRPRPRGHHRSSADYKQKKKQIAPRQERVQKKQTNTRPSM